MFQTNFSYRPVFDFRRFPWRSLLFSILAILIATWPNFAMAATATKSDGLTTQQRAYYQNGGYANDIYQSGQVGDEYKSYVKSLMNEDYVRRCNKNSNPAPKGTSFNDAITKGYTTYADPKTGNMVKVSTQQKFVSGGNLKAKDVAKLGRYNATSSSMAKQIKAGGKASSVLAASKTNAKSLMSKAFGLGGSLVKAGGKLLGVVSGIFMVRDVANGVINFIDKDRFEECMAVTNDFARFLTGMDDVCSQIEQLPRGLPDQLDLSDLPCITSSVQTNAGTICWVDIRPTKYDYVVDIEVTEGKGNGFSDEVFLRFAESEPHDVSGIWLGDQNSQSAGLCNSDFSECDSSGVQSFRDGAGTKHFARVALSLFYRWSDSNPHYWNEIEDAYYAFISGDWTSANYPSMSQWKFNWVDSDGNEVTTKPDHSDLTKKLPPAGATTTVEASDGKTYTATNEGNGDGTIPSPKLPDGVTPTSVTVTAKGSDGVTHTIIPKTNVRDDDTPEVKGTLDLIDTATGNSCYGEGYACADWPTQVKEKTGTEVNLDNKSTTQTHKDMPYKCVWSGDDGSTKELAIGECTVLKKQWKPKETHEGTTGTDPSTGEAVDEPVDNPKPNERPSYGSCVKENVSWNPVSWVYSPVKCALDWAFVPSETNTKTQTVLVRQKVSTTYIDSLVDSFKSAFLGRQELTEAHCLGPEFHLEFMGYQLIPKGSHPLSVCEGSGFEFLPEFSKATCLVLATAVSFLTLRKWIAQAVHFNDDKDVNVDK